MMTGVQDDILERERERLEIPNISDDRVQFLLNEISSKYNKDPLLKELTDNVKTLLKHNIFQQNQIRELIVKKEKLLDILVEKIESERSKTAS